jgi:hypothetical protein
MIAQFKFVTGGSSAREISAAKSLPHTRAFSILEQCIEAR